MNAGTNAGFNGHCYLIEQDRIMAGLPVNGPVRPVQSVCEETPSWSYVKGTDGQNVRTKHGMLMVNSMGEYAEEVNYSNLVTITGHQVQQARAKHELKEYM